MIDLYYINSVILNLITTEREHYIGFIHIENVQAIYSNEDKNILPLQIQG